MGSSHFGEPVAQALRPWAGTDCLLTGVRAALRRATEEASGQRLPGTRELVPNAVEHDF